MFTYKVRSIISPEKPVSVKDILNVNRKMTIVVEETVGYVETRPSAEKYCIASVLLSDICTIQVRTIACPPKRSPGPVATGLFLYVNRRRKQK